MKRYIRNNWNSWIARILIVVILFVPQYYVREQDWQTKAIFAVLSVSLIIFAFNFSVKELLISKEGISVKMKQLNEDTIAVRELGVSIMKPMLIMLAHDDNSWQALNPTQKISAYHSIVNAKDKLDLHDEELDRDIKEAQESIIRCFINSFKGLQLEDSDIFSTEGGHKAFHFDKLKEQIDALLNEKSRKKYQFYYDALQKFIDEINY